MGTHRKRGRSITFGMRPEVRKELEQDIAQRYAAGRTIKSIERACRVSCGFIRSVLRRQGVTLRARGKPKGSPQSGGFPKPRPNNDRLLHGHRGESDCALYSKGQCSGEVKPEVDTGFRLCKTHRQILHAIATRKRTRKAA